MIVRAGYLRISSDVEGERLGVERQRDDISRLAASKFPGEDMAWYEDNDVSAYSGKARPAYEQLLVDIESGAVTGLIGYNFDRVWRRPMELEVFLDRFVPRRLTHVYTVEGDVDLSSHDGQFHARILVAVAKKSSDDMSRRLKRKYLADAAEGKPHGLAPFGYNSDWTVNPDEARRVKAAYKRILTGAPVRQVARDLGVTTTNAKRLLLSPRYAGLRTYKGKVVGPGLWKPLVSVEDHERAVSVISARSHPRGRAPRVHPLTGIISCEDGAKMTGATTLNHDQTLRVYQCPECWRTIVAEKTEQLLEPVLKDIYSRPHMIAALTSPDETDDETRTDLLVTEAKLSELETRYFIDGTIATSDYQRLHSQLTERREKNRQAIRGDSSAPELDFDADWLALPPSEKAYVFRFWFHHITIGPGVRGRRFDPSRVTYHLSAAGLRLLAQSVRPER